MLLDVAQRADAHLGATRQIVLGQPSGEAVIAQKIAEPTRRPFHAEAPGSRCPCAAVGQQSTPPVRAY
jgi:hypothetical protein